jgi:hypothetical protein
MGQLIGAGFYGKLAMGGSGITWFKCPKYLGIVEYLAASL